MYLKMLHILIESILESKNIDDMLALSVSIFHGCFQSAGAVSRNVWQIAKHSSPGFQLSDCKTKSCSSNLNLGVVVDHTLCENGACDENCDEALLASLRHDLGGLVFRGRPQKRRSQRRRL